MSTNLTILVPSYDLRRFNEKCSATSSRLSESEYFLELMKRFMAKPARLREQLILISKRRRDQLPVERPAWINDLELETRNEFSRMTKALIVPLLNQYNINSQNLFLAIMTCAHDLPSDAPFNQSLTGSHLLVYELMRELGRADIVLLKELLVMERNKVALVIDDLKKNFGINISFSARNGAHVYALAKNLAVRLGESKTPLTNQTASMPYMAIRQNRIGYYDFVLACLVMSERHSATISRIQKASRSIRNFSHSIELSRQQILHAVRHIRELCDLEVESVLRGPRVVGYRLNGAPVLAKNLQDKIDCIIGLINEYERSQISQEAVLPAPSKIDVAVSGKALPTMAVTLKELTSTPAKEATATKREDSDATREMLNEMLRNTQKQITSTVEGALTSMLVKLTEQQAAFAPHGHVLIKIPSGITAEMAERVCNEMLMTVATFAQSSGGQGASGVASK